MISVQVQVVQQLKKNIQNVEHAVPGEWNYCLTQLRKVFKDLKKTYPRTTFQLDNILDDLPIRHPKFTDRIILELIKSGILCKSDVIRYVGWRNYKSKSKIRTSDCSICKGTGKVKGAKKDKSCSRCSGSGIKFLKALKGKAKERVVVKRDPKEVLEIRRRQDRRKMKRENAPWGM